MQKKKGQKYQNKKAFQIKFDTKAIEDHKRVKLQHLCKRCLDQIMWKLQFNKYKKQTQPSKCNICQFKVVVKSYHQACDPCALKENICSKCLKKNDEVDQPKQVPILNQKTKDQMNTQQEDRMNIYLKQMREKSRRKVMRQYQKGNYVWEDAQRKFTDKDGNQIPDLKFKGEKDQDQEFDIEEDDEMDLSGQDDVQEDEKNDGQEFSQKKQQKKQLKADDDGDAVQNNNNDNDNDDQDQDFEDEDDDDFDDQQQM